MTLLVDRVTRFALSLVAAGLLVVGTPNPGWAAAADNPSATFMSAELQIVPGRTRETVLTVNSPTDRVMSDLNVTLRVDPGLQAEVGSYRPGLAAGATTIVPVTVTRTAEAATSAAVFAVVDFKLGGDVNSIRSSVAATLTITAPPEATERKAEITVAAVGSREQLIQYQETDLFFTIANPGESAQKVGPLVVSYPSYLTVTYEDPDGKSVGGDEGSLKVGDFGTLQPGDASVVHLSVAADQPLQPGKVLVHMTARATDQTDGSVGTAVGSQTIDLQVLGESGVLTLLAVPALLFVPGLVWILVLWALWRFVSPKRDFALNPGGEGKLVEGKVALWVFALLPSLLFPFLYPAVTGAFGQRRDYRKVYGLDDILYVWLMAAVAAILVWAVAVGGRRAYLWAFIPRERLEPLQLLTKYARRPWRRTLPRQGYFHNGEQRVFTLSKPGNKKILVTPVVEYQTSELSGQHQQAVASPSADPFRLWRVFRKSGSLQYERGRPLTRPTVVPSAELTGAFTDRMWQPSAQTADHQVESAPPAGTEREEPNSAPEGRTELGST